MVQKDSMNSICYFANLIYKQEFFKLFTKLPMDN
jgi:hypothetical protein